MGSLGGTLASICDAESLPQVELFVLPRFREGARFLPHSPQNTTANGDEQGSLEQGGHSLEQGSQGSDSRGPGCSCKLKSPRAQESFGFFLMVLCNLVSLCPTALSFSVRLARSPQD